jgi:hypothetical protein
MSHTDLRIAGAGHTLAMGGRITPADKGAKVPGASNVTQAKLRASFTEPEPPLMASGNLRYQDSRKRSRVWHSQSRPEPQIYQH